MLYKKVVLGTSVIVTMVVLAAFCWSIALASHNININTASVSELETLTGIGAVKAQAIVDYRNQNGPFDSTAEIQNVSGIGEATYNNIKNHITVSGAASDDDSLPESDNDSNENTSTDSGSSAKETKQPVDGLVIEAPDFAYVNQPVQFDAEPIRGTSGRLVRYSWNFGDASVSDSKSPAHAYAYPGTYVVMVSGRYLGEDHVARHEIEILPTALTINRNLSGDVVVTNEANEEIDLGGMSVTGGKTVLFPKHTILLPGRSLTVPAKELQVNSNSLVVLMDQAGQTVSSHSNLTNVLEPTTVFATPVSIIESPATAEIVDEELSAINVVPASTLDITTTSDQEAAAGSARDRLPNGSLPYLGLIGVLSVALISVYLGKNKTT